MNFRTRIATVATALVIAAVPLGNTAANAATPHHNVLRGFCSSHLHTSCVADADNDEGRLAIRDAAGHLIRFHTARGALRYLDHHATACREEDSARCVWDASEAGNGVGESFIVIGGHAEGTGTLWYLGNLD